MTYNKQNFVDGQVLKADHLNNMENGIAQNNASIENLQQNKQDALISGVTIKTINGDSILGTGDIVISGGSGSGGSVETLTEEEENALLEMMGSIPEPPKVPMDIEINQITSTIGWTSITKYSDGGQTTFTGMTLNSYTSGLYYSTEVFEEDTELTITAAFNYEHGSNFFLGACAPAESSHTNYSKTLYYMEKLSNIKKTPQTVTYTVRAGYKFVLAISTGHTLTTYNITKWGVVNE